MIDKDNLAAAELQALADLGTADAAAIISHLPARIGASAASVRADLSRLESKGLLRRVTGYALTDEGREVLAAILRIKGAFPGKGIPGATTSANGTTKADD